MFTPSDLLSRLGVCPVHTPVLFVKLKVKGFLKEQEICFSHMFVKCPVLCM